MTDAEILATLADRYEPVERLQTLARAARDGNGIAGAALGKAVMGGELGLRGTPRHKGRPADIEGDFRIWLAWMRLRCECGAEELSARKRIGAVLRRDARDIGKAVGRAERGATGRCF